MARNEAPAEQIDKLYLLQVRGTLHEVMASSVSELERRASAMRDRLKLSGMVYRVWVGKRPAGSGERFAFGPVAKEACFS